MELFNLYLHPDYPKILIIIGWDRGCRRDGPEVSGGIQLELESRAARNNNDAGVMELVDMLDLGSSAARCESSSLSACTNKNSNGLFINQLLFFVL